MVSLVENFRVVIYHLDGLEVVEKTQACGRESDHQCRYHNSPQLQLEEKFKETVVRQTLLRQPSVDIQGTGDFIQLEFFTSLILP